jgi:protein gp37
MTSKIEWVINKHGKRGFSLNLLRDDQNRFRCTKISEGCDNCYAEKFSARFIDKNLTYNDTKEKIKYHIDQKSISKPFKEKKPTAYFICSLCDLFHKDVSYQTQIEVFKMIKACERHTFFVLTKRALAMYVFSTKQEIPKNCYLGISAEDQLWYDQRCESFDAIEHPHKFLSLEPLLAPINLNIHLKEQKYSWVIVGSESGAKKRLMDNAWAENIVAQCKGNDVPVWVKQVSNGIIPDNLNIKEIYK